jgi:hypothetical protein
MAHEGVHAALRRHLISMLKGGTGEVNATGVEGMQGVSERDESFLIKGYGLPAGPAARGAVTS